MSRAATCLYNLLREYFPGKKIISEYTFSNNLRLDFYIPELNVAFEFDGQQHSTYNNHFYKTKSDFYLAQNRDEQKEYICKQLGIKLIRFTEGEELSLKAIDKRYDGPGSGEMQPGAYKKWISKSVKAKQSKITSRKSAYQEFKKSEYYKQRLKKAKEWRKAKRKERRARG
jgi:hypothetical protein